MLLYTFLGSFNSSFKDVHILMLSWDVSVHYLLHYFFASIYDSWIREPLLGVIREQGEWPLRPKGARSIV